MSIDAADPVAAPPVAPAAPRKSFMERVVGVFFSPESTFDDIVRKPDIVLPLILLTVIGFVSAILTVPHLDLDAMVNTQAEMMQKKNPNMSDADIERMGRITKAMAKVGGYISPLLIIIGYVLIALALWGAFRLMGGQGDFKQSFSTTLYAYMPRMIIGGILGTIIVILRGSVDPQQAAAVTMTNPAFLVDFKEQPVLFALAAAFDLFVIWTLFLLTVGFSKVSKFPKAKSAMIIIVLWLVTVVIRVGMAAVGAASMKG
ncbi:MAG TPA: Yip1 family protein [Thermoanaerobaculia bacterium]|nr:Yip1 family protein [Thermoanaerobaculia bacterium]